MRVIYLAWQIPQTPSAELLPAGITRLSEGKEPGTENEGMNEKTV